MDSSLISEGLEFCSDPSFGEEFELFVAAGEGEPTGRTAVFDVPAERSDGEVGVADGGLRGELDATAISQHVELRGGQDGRGGGVGCSCGFSAQEQQAISDGGKRREQIGERFEILELFFSNSQPVLMALKYSSMVQRAR